MTRDEEYLRDLKTFNLVAGHPDVTGIISRMDAGNGTFYWRVSFSGRCGTIKTVFPKKADLPLIVSESR